MINNPFIPADYTAAAGIRDIVYSTERLSHGLQQDGENAMRLIEKRIGEMMDRECGDPLHFQGLLPWPMWNSDQYLTWTAANYHGNYKRKKDPPSRHFLLKPGSNEPEEVHYGNQFGSGQWYCRYRPDTDAIYSMVDDLADALMSPADTVGYINMYPWYRFEEHCFGRYPFFRVLLNGRYEFYAHVSITGECRQWRWATPAMRDRIEHGNWGDLVADNQWRTIDDQID